MPKRNVACFCTVGYTELEMKPFFEKMNKNISFIQKTPIKPRKRELDIRNRTNNLQNNGLTGRALIDYVVDHIKSPKYHFFDDQYEAIIIEDDKDDRFITKKNHGVFEIDFDSKKDAHGNGTSGWIETRKTYADEIRNAIKSIDTNYPDIPIIFLLAAPEVEAWFLADWDNSFGSIYRETSRLSAHQNITFSIRFKQYINDIILTQQYRNDIETFGYFVDGYRKLSSEIQTALEKEDFLKDQQPHSPLYYSKQTHGQKMLRNIDPEIVAQKCCKLFRPAYEEIKAL